MTWVIIKEHKFYLHEGETLLGGLLRQGYAVDFQCKQGYCGSCRVRLLDHSHPVCYADPPLAMIKEGEVLSCCCQIQGVVWLDLD